MGHSVRCHDAWHHFNEVFDHGKLVDAAKHALNGVRFDTFVGTGLSGTLSAPVLARAMRKNFVIVRKDSDQTHDVERVLGNMGERFVIVDDLIASGDTWRAIIDELGYWRDHRSAGDDWSGPLPAFEFVGIYLYHGGFTYPKGFHPAKRFHHGQEED
jgi:hypothetical protein